MFDVGFAELFLLFVVGLLVLGPERLPAVARTLGGFLRKARSSWYQLKRSIETELAAADVSEPLKAAQKEIKKASREFSEFGKQSILPPEDSPPASIETNAETGKTPQPDQDDPSDR